MNLILIFSSLDNHTKPFSFHNIQISSKIFPTMPSYDIVIDEPDDAANLRIFTEKIINNTLDLKMQIEQNKMNLTVIAVLIPKQPLKSTTNDDYLSVLMSLVLKKIHVMI